MADITAAAKHGMASDIEHVQDTNPSAMADEKEVPITAYIADHSGSHHKSKEERAVVLKADLLIVPLCALLYFVAYLVCPLPYNYSYHHSLHIPNESRIAIASAMQEFWECKRI